MRPRPHEGPRSSRLAKTPRSLALIAAAIALLAPCAAARAGDPPAPDVTGDWAIEGEHETLGAFEGGAQLRRLSASNAGATYYDYRAELLFASGRRERLAGRAEQRGAELLLSACAQRGFGGVAGALSAQSIADGDPRARPSAAPLRLEHLALCRIEMGADRAEGAFIERSAGDGAALGGGRLSLVAREPNGHALELYVDGHEFFPAVGAAIAAARDHVHVEFYIVKDDDTGRAFADELIAARRRGVAVRVKLDRLGADEAGDLPDRLREAGVEVVIGGGYVEGLVNLVGQGARDVWSGVRGLLGFGPLPPREKRTIANRDHRKLVIVDGERAFVGGMNVSDEYGKEWHDVMAGVSGPIVRELQRCWFERWRTHGGAMPAEDAMPRYFRRFPRAVGPYEGVDVLEGIPGLVLEIRDAYLEAIGAAQQKILIENAYFLDEDILAALSAARGRDVRVVVIVPSDEHNDVGVVAEASFFVHNDLIRRGVELRHYRGRMVHTKVATIDGRWSTVGSANLDHVGLHEESELNLEVRDPRFAKELERRIFAPDVRDSDLVPVREVGFFEKAKKGLFHLFRNVL